MNTYCMYCSHISKTNKQSVNKTFIQTSAFSFTFFIFLSASKWAEGQTGTQTGPNSLTVQTSCLLSFKIHRMHVVQTFFMAGVFKCFCFIPKTVITAFCGKTIVPTAVTIRPGSIFTLFLSECWNSTSFSFTPNYKTQIPRPARNRIKKKHFTFAVVSPTQTKAARERDR